MSNSEMTSTTCRRPQRRAGGVWVRCHSHDFAKCSGCARLYQRDVREMMRDGFKEGYNYFFLTLTAPGFGATHSGPSKKESSSVLCRCGETHEHDDPLIGTPLDPRRYQYRRAMSWNLNSAELFRRTMSYLTSSMEDTDWVCVREYQRRAAIHFHLILRVSDDQDATTVYNHLKKARTYHYGEYRWGREMRLELIPTDDPDEQTSNLSRMMGYSAKTLGTSVDLPSPEQSSHYRKLDFYASQMGCSPAQIRGYGYGGQLFTRSKGWTTLTQEALKERRRQWAIENPDPKKLEADRKRNEQLLEASRRELEVIAATRGFSGTYRPNTDDDSSWVRKIVLGTRSEGLENSDINLMSTHRTPSRGDDPDDSRHSRTSDDRST